MFKKKKKKKKLGVGGGEPKTKKKEIGRRTSLRKKSGYLKCPPTLRSGVIMASSSSPNDDIPLFRVFISSKRG